MSHPLVGLLDWTLRRLAHYLNTFGYRLIQDGGELSDLFVSLEEVQRVLLAGQANRAHFLGLPEGVADEPLPADERLDLLRRRFDLDELDARLLVAAAAPGLSVDLGRLYRFAWADFTHKTPPVGFLAELVAGAFGSSAGLSAFDPARPLRRHRLIELRGGGGAEGPLSTTGVVVPEPVLGWLRGAPRSRPRESGAVAFPIDVEARRLLAAVAGQMARDPTRCLPLVLIGAPGVGRRAALAEALEARGIGLHVVEVGEPPHDAAALDAEIGDAARAARMYGEGLLIVADDLPDDSGLAEVILPRLAALGDDHRGVLALTSSRCEPRVQRAVEAALDVEFARPGTEVQRGVWQAALGEGADPAVAEAMVQRFNLTPGTIHGAVREVRHWDRLVGEGAPRDELPRLTRAVRRRILHTLGAYGEPVETTLGWEDVVLASEVEETLREIELQARHRSQVFDVWGFADKMPYGRGLACLFSGPPGTGKTMMAGIIARSLGLLLYRVDVSRLVSKWVGETEKNLARVFDEAEKAQAVLLFDEADSLFAKRTEVKGANDRFANMEVNYLLQRMERYDGMSILTTNFEQSLDEAFKRRLRFRVHFGRPDAHERALLWQRMIPGRMQVAEDVDWTKLGRKYDLSGGSIKNAVLRAAFLAADGDGVLTMERLHTAGRAEMREMGRL